MIHFSVPLKASEAQCFEHNIVPCVECVASKYLGQLSQLSVGEITKQLKIVCPLSCILGGTVICFCQSLCCLNANIWGR